MDSIKILGIDPSLTNFGYAFGCYSPEDDHFDLKSIWQATTEPPPKGYKGYKNHWDYERAVRLSLSLQDALKADPDIVAIEMPHGSQSARACVGYGVCIGVLSQIKTKVIITRERDAKILATGSHKAEKSEMISAAYNEYPFEGWKKHKNGELMVKNEHCSDAVWAVLTCLTYDEFREFLE